MKKLMLLTVCFVFLFAGVAKADTLQIGSHYTSPIYITINGVAKTEGGGSFDPSYLNGQLLNYMYCVDLFHTINVPGNYSNSLVNDDGLIHGQALHNAGQVAWLLSHYGTNGHGEAAYALQVAIWHVIYAGTATPVGIGAGSTANEIALYNSYLAALGTNTGNVADFLWITPKDCSGEYQGQVSHVPEPMGLLLLGLGLVGLAGARKKVK